MYDSSNPKLIKSYVCVTDILGFTQLTREYYHKGKGNELLKKLITTLRYNTLKIQTSELVSRLRLFSDNIAIGWPITDIQYEGMIDLANLLSKLASFQLALSLNGFFIRGAVSVGLHYMDNTIIYGPALLEAHDLEKKKAIHPKVILSENIKKLIKNYITNNTERHFIDLYILRDHEDNWFLSYLSPIQEILRFDFDNDTTIKYLMKHKHIVIQNLNSYKNDPKIYNKYAWSANYHNYFCRLYNFKDENLIIDGFDENFNRV